jgi:hypothetical protein
MGRKKNLAQAGLKQQGEQYTRDEELDAGALHAATDVMCAGRRWWMMV